LHVLGQVACDATPNAEVEKPDRLAVTVAGAPRLENQMCAEAGQQTTHEGTFVVAVFPSGADST